jgi:hypothetical protein
MLTNERKPSSAVLAAANAQAMAHYRDMRVALMPAPGVDTATCEIVLAMQLALRGHEVPFKVHAMRAMAQGVSPAQLEGLLMAGIGVTLVAFETARALEWLREAQAESHPSASLPNSSDLGPGPQ